MAGPSGWVHRCLLFTILGVAVAIAGPDSTTALRPRPPLSKPATITRPGWPSELTLKLRDDLRARALPTGLVSESGAALTAVHSIAARHSLTFVPRLRLPQSKLDFLEQRAAARSGNAQPDLASILAVRGPEAVLERAAQELLALDEVEWVHFAQIDPEPPCSDLAPETPHYYASGLQPYHGPDPGLNMAYAWTLGARGQGIKIADCEYGWIIGSEDLCDIVNEPGQTISATTIANGWDNHGTSVFGEMIGLDNGYGITGLVPEASGLFFPENSAEEGPRRLEAITNAIATVDPGDLVVLEMQTVGPGGDYGPAELDPDVWSVVKLGTDSGVVVVAAAGNGNQNLDGAPYATYMSWGDSGAIIVGAGSASIAHNKLNFSTYGSRVNVHAWGQSVFSQGYGDFAELGGDKKQRYTATFGGTSSATPLVSSAAAAIQSLVVATHGCRMDSKGVRQLLIDTGIPQGAGGHIGPFPDMQAAADAALDIAPDCSYGCGNNHVDGSEICDGTDDAACPGPCDSDCTCHALGPGPVEGVVVTDYVDASDQLWIQWSPACASTNHALVAGPLGGVAGYGYTKQLCSLGVAGTYGPFKLGAGDWFFLVVAHNGVIEGSYGTDSDGNQRPEMTTGFCTLQQDLSLPCGAD